MTLQQCINQINNVLEELGVRRAYDIKHPSYNYRGYCFRRIAAAAQALDLSPPEDVPVWDYWAETWYDAGHFGEFFWKLWAWKKSNEGEPPMSQHDWIDLELNAYAGCTIILSKTKEIP